LSQFVEQQERGLLTEISEAGLSLSGGQAQRLALARAFYHQPKLLILDEPSSHLDFVTEQIIQHAITQYAKEHLVIVIAHRLNTIIDAKNIIVLADGKVIEQGTHQQLLNINGTYAAAIIMNENVMSEKVHDDV
ncbi:MAG: ATP-binding cassette domain-containing protein, partial [Psychrobium sp.]|nr:ATP-binding cassette domain-containing protein [Psychrobium sp.]